jgi:polyisoprenoid-binding protein YceI
MKKHLAIVLINVLSLTSTAYAIEERLVLDAQKTTITFTLDSTLHMVHGTMLVESGLITFDLDTGLASGTITLDATKTKTGNTKRDKKMHKTVLESPEFPLIVFTPTHIERIQQTRSTETINLFGQVLIHGATHELVIKAEIQRQGKNLSGTCTFRVPFVDWHMKDPSVFVFHTDKHVDVSLNIHGIVTSSSE